MKLGTISYNIGKDWDLPTMIRIARGAELDGIELRSKQAHGVEPDISVERRKEVRQQIADAGLTLWGLGTECQFHMPDAGAVRAQIEMCKHWCELANAVGARGLRVFPNDLPAEIPIEQTMAQIAAALRECAPAAEANGVELWLEVHGRASAYVPHIRTILDQCQHPNIGALWNSEPRDVVNGSVKEHFELLRPYLRSCHMHDLWGPYPYRELFALMHQSGYDRFTMCEMGMPMPPEAGLPFLQCYRALWRELGGA